MAKAAEKAAEKTVEKETEVKNEVAVTAEAEAPAVVAPALNPFAGIDLGQFGFTEDELSGLTGLDNIGASEVSIPYAHLVSKVTKDYQLGDIVFPDGSVVRGKDGEIAEAISILAIQPVRVMFPTPFNPKNSFTCRSIDGITGHTDGQYAGRKCSECEFSKYPEAGGASPCRDQRLLLCTKADGSLFHIQAAGVSIKPWKTFLSAQAFHLLPKVRQIMGALKVNLGVKFTDTDFGQFPYLDFNINPEDPFVGQERMMNNLTALKSYKEFEKQHLESAAEYSKVQMATSGEETAQGENAQLF